MPPNGDSGSVANARSHASSGSSADADAARRVVLQDRDRRVGRSGTRAASASAASTSTTLLYESSLPWSGSATLQEVAVERRPLVRVLAVAHVERLRSRPSGTSAPKRRLRLGAEVVGDRAVVGAVVWKTFCASRRSRRGRHLAAASRAARRGRPRSRRDRRSRSRRRGSSPPSAASTGRRCRSSRSPPRASCPASRPSARTGRGSPPRGRSARCRARAIASQVLGQVAPAEQPAVDLRVQRLHAAVEHLGEARVVAHLRHRRCRRRRAPSPCRRSRGSRRPARAGPRANSTQPALVADAEQRPRPDL